MVLVDTSAWVEFHRKNGRLEVKMAMVGLLTAMEATLCGPVEMEFLGGAHPTERSRIEKEWSLIPYLRNDQKIWRKAADTCSMLRSKGLVVPWNDVLIATLALGADCRIYTIDKHFEAMAPLLGLHLYQPGYNGSFRPEHE